jgi:hypothetical protein
VVVDERLELTEDEKTSLETPYTAQDNYWW